MEYELSSAPYDPYRLKGLHFSSPLSLSFWLQTHFGSFDITARRAGFGAVLENHTHGVLWKSHQSSTVINQKSHA